MKLPSNTLLYKNIDLSKALQIPMFTSSWKLIILSLFRHDHFEVNGCLSPITIFYTHDRSNRKDYREIVDNLNSILDNSQIISLIPRFSLLKLILCVCRSISLYGKLGPNGLFLDKVAQALLLAKAQLFVDDFSQHILTKDVDIAVTFSDAHFYDNLIAQICNGNNITTVTLQHGQYHLSKNDCAENLTLTNIVSDYLCCWGQATFDEYKKVSGGQTKVEMLGILRKFEVTPYSYKSVTKILASKGVICVLLNADNSMLSNLRLLNIISEYCKKNASKYSVRFHPRNNKQLYSTCFDQNYVGDYSAECFDVAFSIMYTSGVMLEYLISGQPIFLLEDEQTPDLFQLDRISFKSSDDLLKLIEYVQLHPFDTLNYFNQLRDYFSVRDDFEISYQKFFKRISS